ncbi:MAG: hypothetical protein ACYTG0_06110 [Planctomycetota bacterium]|jgi:hypothetical protein
MGLALRVAWKYHRGDWAEPDVVCHGMEYNFRGDDSAVGVA